MLIVAGGGGGSYFHNNFIHNSYGDGGAGGGEVGSPGILSSKTMDYPYGFGGTQTNAGTHSSSNSFTVSYQAGGFGQGANGGGYPTCGGGGGPGVYAGCGGGSGYLNEKLLISGTTGMQNGIQSGNGKATITLTSFK